MKKIPVTESEEDKSAELSEAEQQRRRSTTSVPNQAPVATPAEEAEPEDDMVIE